MGEMNGVREKGGIKEGSEIGKRVGGPKGALA